MRDYHGVVRRIEKLPSEHLTREEVGEVDGFPLLRVRASSDPSLPTIMVMSGTHGDEPAGVEAALSLLEGRHAQWLESFQFEVIPCLNPHGYVHYMRHNIRDVDINWAFRREDVPEVDVVKQLVAGRRFEAIVDFHEDWESPGYYLYEQARGRPAIGLDIVRRVSEVCPINRESDIEGSPADGGVVHPDIGAEVQRRGEGIPIALYNGHTDHLITSETPTRESMGRRVQAHLITLDAMAEAHTTAAGEGRGDAG